MRKITLVFLFCISFIYSQVEYKYESNKENLPNWVKEMYSNNPDPGKIELLYNNYYSENEFIKNKHTQFYKRWKRSLTREILIPKHYKSVQRNNTNLPVSGFIFLPHLNSVSPPSSTSLR